MDKSRYLLAVRAGNALANDAEKLSQAPPPSHQGLTQMTSTAVPERSAQ
jgi:hypothetical protein